jgi:hypothetical protein
MSAKKFDDNTLDALPDDAQSNLYKGAHVRQYTSKLRTKVRETSGEILYFIRTVGGKKKYRAFVAWRPEEGEHTDQFVDIELLRLENTPPPPRKVDPTINGPGIQASDPKPRKAGTAKGRVEIHEDFDESIEESDDDMIVCAGDLEKKIGCGGELKFDPNLVGDTCGGLTRKGWLVCVKCGRGWYSDRGTSYTAIGSSRKAVDPWKQVTGGSASTVPRIRKRSWRAS